MYILWLWGSSVFLLKAFWSAKDDSFFGFIVNILLMGLFQYMARRERD